jgi:hypothetical protein
MKPRNDKCNTCEEFKISNKNDPKFQNHLQLKNLTENHRNADRKKKDELIVCFDLQKVITCPKSFINNFYYKRKENIYNLTACDSLSRTGYCSVWDESVCGRTSNDIASALIIILENFFEKHPNIDSLFLWSDSCVGQNKNSIITYALAHFMKNHRNLKVVTLKFAAPGHSSVQEVDNMHSFIEKI